MILFNLKLLCKELLIWCGLKIDNFAFDLFSGRDDVPGITRTDRIRWWIQNNITDWFFAHGWPGSKSELTESLDMPVEHLNERQMDFIQSGLSSDEYLFCEFYKQKYVGPYV